MSVDQPFNIYREQLSSQYQGLALWDPKPVENLHKRPGHVSIGDVGYLDNGAFMRMFNVTLPWDDPSNKLIGKPEKYEHIEPCYSGHIRDNEIREGEYCTSHVSEVDNVGADRHEDSLGQMYQCRAQHRGAFLSLPYKGHRKDVIPMKVFGEYIRDNVDRWFRWSKKMKLPVERMEDLILVTGCTLVASWAAAAFDGHMSVDSDATTISLEARKSDDGRAQYFWRNIRGNVEYHNSRFDPNVQEPLPQNQCVFIRGFRAKRTFFRTIPMRAAAEPLPDDPDDRQEDEIQVTRIPDSSNYRDPLVGILDYIMQKCNQDISTAEDVMAIAHDDDLQLIEGVETLTADAIENFLHEKQLPLIVKNGSAILRDSPTKLIEPADESLHQQPTPQQDSPRLQLQYDDGDSTPYKGDQSPYKPSAPGPSRSNTNQSVRTRSSTAGSILDHSHLRPSKQAALLSHERTLELYRANAKKTQDPDLQFEFAVFMVNAYKALPVPEPMQANVMDVEEAIDKHEGLIKEATSLLKRNADRGHMPSQYFLADCYANGIGTHENRQDFDRALPLFILAAKQGHPDAAYRAGMCFENGWGCRRQSPKAVQFYRKAVTSSHPGALYRLGIAELNGELGLSKRPKEGVKWLKRSAEHATAEFPQALHELALLHERGIHNVVPVDYEYSVELLAQAAELGYAPSAYRLGEHYEYGKMGCPQDPALSIRYYKVAARQNHRDACFALTAWYLVGSPGVLPQSDTEAFLWAKRAADGGLARAMYAVGYFCEVGIGTPANQEEATAMFKKAADLGDKRAEERLRGNATGPIAPDSVVQRDGYSVDDGGADIPRTKDKECIVM